MKTVIITISLLFCGTLLQAQQIDFARNTQFVKSMDEINSGKAVLKYSDIKGNAFYKNGFNNAKIGETTTILPIRYNMFKDSFEILNNNDVYAVPKDNIFSTFTFVSSNEKFVLGKDDEGFAGYFLVLSEGKHKLLKKMLVKFYPEVPAQNSMVPGTPAKFEKQKPIYFIKTDDKIVKLTKKPEDLINAFPEEKKNEVKDFIKNNKIKLTEELDLIKLINFLNK